MFTERLIRGSALAVSALTIAISGCSGIVESLNYDSRLLVKLPGTTFKETASAGPWKFRHIVDVPKDIDPAGQWYVAWRDDDVVIGLSMPGRRWRHALKVAPELVDATKRALGVYPLMIEPNLVFVRMAARVDMTQRVAPQPVVEKRNPSGAIARLEYAAPPSPSWPIARTKDGMIRPTWYLDEDYSELSRAAARVRKVSSGARIRIGILDDGFSAAQRGLPEHLVDDKRGDAMNLPVSVNDDGLEKPGDTGASHGTGTIGILAGKKVSIKQKAFSGQTVQAFDGYLGGAPDADVVAVRIAPWVFSVSTANLAYGIDYASRIERCDVLSLSHGGSPCQAWADAVNAAYLRGTAMFAAEGDFFSLVSDPLQPNGIIVPSGPVYPAAFRRVLGVTGATSDRISYARNSFWRLFRYPLAIVQWTSRGSYGPDGSWRTPFMHSEKPDLSEVNRMGSLRAYPIAGYSPNIPWLRAPTQNDKRTGLIDLNGSGTSAATPQVAAAAALWLQFHRREIEQGRENKWRRWEKAEAVYTALLLSADRQPGHSWPDRYLGAGLLKANRALNVNFDQVQGLLRRPLTQEGEQFMTSSEPLTNGQKLELRYAKSPRDFFDGARSVLSLLGFVKSNNPAYRADLDQLPVPNESREQALARVYYNTLLLGKWHSGALPQKGRDEYQLRRLAAHMASATSSSAH
jgi:subtilase family protein